MQVEFNVRDFLDRAAAAYPERIARRRRARPAGRPLGAAHLRRLAARARAQAAGLDRLGIAPGERVAIVSHNSARLLTSFFGVSGWGRILVPVNFRLARAEVEYILEHSGASVLLVDPELDEAAGRDRPAPAASCSGRRATPSSTSPTPNPRRWASDEDGHRHHQLHLGHHGPAQGRPAHPPQLLGQRRRLRVAHRGVRPRRLPPHPADVPCQRLGHAVDDGGHGRAPRWRCARSTAPRSCAGSSVTGSPCCARRPPWSTPCSRPRADWDGELPGRGTTRIVVAGAPPPSRTIERIEAELGWEFIQIYGLTETSPLLTVNRARAEWDGLPSDQRARKLDAGRCPAVGTGSPVDERGEVLARSNTVMEGYWRQPEETAGGPGRRLVPHRRRRPLDDEGHLSILDRKKDVIITGGENVSSIEVEDAIFSLDGVARGGGDRGAPRASGARWSWPWWCRPRGRGHRGGRDRPLPDGAGRVQVPRSRSRSATSCPAPPPASSRSSGSARPTGRASTARSTDGRRRLHRPAPVRARCPAPVQPLPDPESGPHRGLEHGCVADVPGHLEVPVGLRPAAIRRAVASGTSTSRSPWRWRTGGRSPAGRGGGRSGEQPRERPGRGQVGLVGEGAVPVGGQGDVGVDDVARHPGGSTQRHAQHPAHGLLGGGAGRGPRDSAPPPRARRTARSWPPPGGGPAPGRPVGRAGSTRTRPATGRAPRRPQGGDQAAEGVAHEDDRSVGHLAEEAVEQGHVAVDVGRAVPPTGVRPWPSRSTATSRHRPTEWGATAAQLRWDPPSPWTATSSGPSAGPP